MTVFSPIWNLTQLQQVKLVAWRKLVTEFHRPRDSSNLTATTCRGHLVLPQAPKLLDRSRPQGSGATAQRAQTFRTSLTGRP